MLTRLPLACALAALPLAPAFAAPAAGASALRFAEPWIREAPPTAQVLGGYFELSNPTGAAVVLRGVSAPGFEEVQMHSLEEAEDGRMRMVRHETWTVPAQGTVRFAPGGNHLMLMRPTRPLKAEDTLPLTFDFGASGKRVVSFTVRSMVQREHHDD